MAYTRVWPNNIAGTAAANDIEVYINNSKEDIEERMDDLIGDPNWSGASDPIINGTTIKSLKALTTAVIAGLSDILSVTGNVATVAAGKFLKEAQPHHFAISYSGQNLVADNTIRNIPSSAVLNDPRSLVHATGFTVPADAAGMWLLQAYFYVSALSIPTAVYSLYFAKSSATATPLSGADSVPSIIEADATDPHRLFSIQRIVDLAAGDNVGVYYQANGGAVSIPAGGSRFIGVRLG